MSPTLTSTTSLHAPPSLSLNIRYNGPVHQLFLLYDTFSSRAPWINMSELLWRSYQAVCDERRAVVSDLSPQTLPSSMKDREHSIGYRRRQMSLSRNLAPRYMED